MQTLMRSSNGSSDSIVRTKFSPIIIMEAQNDEMDLAGNDGVLLENAKEGDTVDLISKCVEPNLFLLTLEQQQQHLLVSVGP